MQPKQGSQASDGAQWGEDKWHSTRREDKLHSTTREAKGHSIRREAKQHSTTREAKQKGSQAPQHNEGRQVTQHNKWSTQQGNQSFSHAVQLRQAAFAAAGQGHDAVGETASEDTEGSLTYGFLTLKALCFWLGSERLTWCAAAAGFCVSDTGLCDCDSVHNWALFSSQIAVKTVSAGLIDIILNTYLHTHTYISYTHTHHTYIHTYTHTYMHTDHTYIHR